MPYDALGFGTGWGYPGELITLAFVGPWTIHSLCPSGLTGPVIDLDGIVVKIKALAAWSFLFASTQLRCLLADL